MADEITLRQYVDMRFHQSDRSVQAALAAAKEAVTKAEAATEKRFESVNEFRQALTDRDRLNMPRTEVEQRFNSQDEKFKDMQDKITKVEGKLDGREERMHGLSEGWAIYIAIAGIVTSIIAVVYAIVHK